jgi:hypothetical protein
MESNVQKQVQNVVHKFTKNKSQKSGGINKNYLCLHQVI